MNNNKILIITEQLKSDLIAYAIRFKNIIDFRSIPSEEPHLARGWTLSHEHPQFGKQSLIVDKLTDNAFVVSFAGSQEYLDHINSSGWLSSAETLQTYLMDLDPQMEEFLATVAVVEYNEQIVFAGVIGDNTELNMELIASAVSSTPGADPVDEVVEATTQFVDQLSDEVNTLLDPPADEVASALGEAIVETDEQINAASDTAAPSTDEPSPSSSERKFRMFKNLSPKTKFIIAETARVCVCVAGVIVVGSLVEKAAHALFDKAPASPFEM